MDYQHNLFMKQDALTTQVGGDHYREMAIQPTEFIHANGIGFIAGNVIKYVCRHKIKGGKQDLEKAAHYLQMLIAMEYPEAAKAEDDGWIPWGGHKRSWPDGRSPYDKVTVKMRDGKTWTCFAHELNWNHAGNDDDIVAYKIAPI